MAKPSLLDHEMPPLSLAWAFASGFALVLRLNLPLAPPLDSPQDPPQLAKERMGESGPQWKRYFCLLYAHFWESPPRTDEGNNHRLRVRYSHRSVCLAPRTGRRRKSARSRPRVRRIALSLGASGLRVFLEASYGPWEPRLQQKSNQFGTGAFNFSSNKADVESDPQSHLFRFMIRPLILSWLHQPAHTIAFSLRIKWVLAVTMLKCAPTIQFR